MAVETNVLKDKRYGLAEQTVWGTVIADGAAFLELDCEPFTINRDTKFRERNEAHAARYQLHNDITADTVRSMPAATVAGEALLGSLDYFLYLYTQAVTEVGGGVEKKTFTIPTTQPDFTTNAGIVATLCERDPVASRSVKVTDMIAKSLTLTCNKGERLKFSSELIGRNSIFNSNPSGTWTRAAVISASTTDFWHFENMARATINFGAGAQSPVFEGWELSLSNVIEGIGFDSGKLQQFAIVSRDMSFKLKIAKDAQVQSALTNYDAGTAVTVNLGWGHATPGTSNKDLDLAFTGKLNAVPFGNEQILTAEVTGKMSSPATGTSPLTIVMANSINRAW